MTKIFAHRGASKFAPENTLSAFKLALRQGAEGLETDIHLTKDHIPVIIHDDTVDRTTNNSGLIKDYTYNEIKQLDAGSWFSSSFSNETILSLEEFLVWIQGKNVLINIELKNNKIDYPQMETIVYEMINRYQLRDRTIISTFNARSIQRCKKIDPLIEVAWLTSKRNRKLIQDAHKIQTDAIHIHYRLLSKRLMRKAHQYNIPVRVYTLNKRRHLKKCFALQCDAVFTDLPDFSRLIRENKKYRRF